MLSLIKHPLKSVIVTPCHCGDGQDKFTSAHKESAIAVDSPLSHK
jgi:hypothetical protein